jgi:hypothetical protein
LEGLEMNNYTEINWTSLDGSLYKISKNTEKIAMAIDEIKDYLFCLPDIAQLLSELVDEIKNMRKPNKDKKEE